MQTFKVDSPYNNQIKLKVSQGHFATSSSHINYYIDLTTLKARSSEAKAVAKSLIYFGSCAQLQSLWLLSILLPQL